MRPTDKKLSSLIFGLALATLVIALAAMSFQRKVASFQTLGFQAQLTQNTWTVSAIDDPSVPLEVGDQILLVNAGEASNIGDLRKGLHSQPKSQLVVQRQGMLVPVEYLRPALAIDLPYLILAIIGAIYLIIGLYTLLRSRQQAGSLFYAWCLLYALLFLLTDIGEFDPADRLFYSLDQLARLLLPALTVHFFLVFPGRLSQSTLSRRILPFLYLPGAVLLALQADLMFASGRFLLGADRNEAALGSAISVLQRLDQYHLVLFSLAVAGLLAFRLHKERNWEERRQVQWIALGMSVGYLPLLGYLLFQELPFSVGRGLSAWLEILVVLPLGLVPLAFAWSILRYKLWDLDVIVRDVVAYTATALVAVIGFSLINLGLSRGLPAELGMARNLVSFTAGLMFAALVVPVRQQISSTLERLQYRGGFGRRRALQGLAGQLLHERNLGHLCSVLLDSIREALDFERVNLFLAQAGSLVPARSEPGTPSRLSFDCLEEDLWDREVSGVSAFDLPLEDNSEVRRLYTAGYRYAFPLMVRGAPVGVLFTGYKAEARPLSSDDQDLIRGLLNQASLAIENAKLVDQLSRRLDEVGRLKSYSEGLIDSSPAGTVVLDSQDRIVSINQAFCQMTGHSETACIGQELETFLPVRPLPLPGENIVEVSFCDPAGEERYFQLSTADFQPDLEQQLRILVIHDVSERVALENALKEKDRLASLGMLAAGVAHEVNTPITGISSYAQMLLADTPAEDPRHGLLKKVEAQTFRAARIVNNLLEFARNRRGEYRPLTLNGLITDTLDLLREKLYKSRIRLAWDAPETAFVIQGSEGELQQVFTNLVLNAHDAMMDRGGEIRVSLSEEGHRTVVTIEDNGPGIPQERLEKIFQPFFSTKLNRGGTGLGLSISYDIVRRHGGTLNVSSELGVGTRFTVDLPRPEASLPPSA
ncbi:MAG: PAS domain S-box protein [Deltaproteobacteria bacterium]|nr:PAS domain S-box protein [Deltaproteobacteria bacterium]